MDSLERYTNVHVSGHIPGITDGQEQNQESEQKNTSDQGQAREPEQISPQSASGTNN